MFPLLETESAALIAADLPIISAFSDEAAEIRYWKIKGFGPAPASSLSDGTVF